MKRFLLIIFFLLPVAAAFAQTDSIYVWNKWCSRKDSLLLFTSGNNVIQIYSRTLKPADIKLKCLDNSLRIGTPEIKGDTMSVLAMPYSGKGKAKKMRLAILNKKTSKQIKVLDFACDSIPPFVARVGNIQGTEAARKDILAQTVLKGVFPGSLYSYPYTIRQYTFKMTTGLGTTTIPVKGIFLNTAVMKAIKEAPTGTVIEFTGIIATCPECAVRTLNDTKLKIK